MIEAIEEQISAIYAEQLVDGRWQVQVVAKDCCTPSDWFEADTIAAAAALALDRVEDEPQYECVNCGEPIMQRPIRMPGTDVLGYQRSCDDCIDAKAEDHLPSWRDRYESRLPHRDTGDSDE